FNHSQYVALKVKDAIVDKFKNKINDRPNVNTQNPDVRIHIHISGSVASLLLDSSGDSLHKRSYRIATTEAPINEILAAGLVLLSGWKGETIFVDPMCGSGTIAIEAAMIAKNMAPNINRSSFGFQRWKNYDEALWESVRQEAIDQEKEADHWIFAHDIDQRAIEIARKNIEKAGVDDSIKSAVKAIEHTPLPHGGMMITNPPYDHRLSVDDVNAFYRTLGDALKQHYSGYTVWILSANKDAMKHIGLKASRRLTLHNGALECKYYQYEMYSGSKKKNEE
ncbi:MAG TPA: methyltransferase, partial [Chitinophagales bacterium]|nr:methyltransferase [Chitinophagales bacterium]